MLSGNPNKHFIYSLNVDTGATNAGWPVDVDATPNYNGIQFSSVPAGGPRRARSGAGEAVRALLRIFWGLRQLSWLGSGRGH